MADFDVWIGTQKLDEMDWRADGALADDNDEDPTEAPPEVISFLGFDPFEEEVDPDSVDGDNALTAADKGNAVYNKAKARYAELDLKASIMADRLNFIAGPEKGPMGLTPEHIRLSPEYRAAKREYDKAAAELKTFAAGFVKQFKKEQMLERRDPDYHAKRQPERLRLKGLREKALKDFAKQYKKEHGGVPLMASTAEIAAASVRSLKRMPRKMASVQKPVNVKTRDIALNRTRPGMKFLHRTEEVGGRPAEMKVFAVKGGSIYYDEPNARKPGFYCDPGYFYSKVFKEWVK